MNNAIYKALMETVSMVSVAIIVGVLLGLVLGCSVYLSRKDGLRPHKFIAFIGNGYINAVRSFPFLILVILMIPITRSIVGTGFGTRASMVPLAVIAIALFARQAEQAFLEVDKDVIMAAISMGGSPFQIMRHVVIREAMPGLMLGLTTTLISLISYSTVMGVVGGGGIGDFAIIYGYQSNRMDLVLIAVVLLIILVQGIQAFGMIGSKKLDKR